eukprot:6210895-Pleurochrysis_carterae.AAC.2
MDTTYKKYEPEGNEGDGLTTTTMSVSLILSQCVATHIPKVRSRLCQKLRNGIHGTLVKAGEEANKCLRNR